MSNYVLPSARAIERVHWVVFVCAVAFRLAYLLQSSPLDHLFSDPQRHWINGTLFTAPTLMGSIDPIGYQFWLRVLQFLDRDRHVVVLTGTAALSLGLPVFWLLALRELLPWSWALAGATLIALAPSLLPIYSYFMNETLLLALMAGGFWLAVRGMRTGGALTLAALAQVWAGAAYTRVVAVPVAALCFFAVCVPISWPRRALTALAFVACFALFAMPACWHSFLNLHYCAPFGSGYLNATYRASAAKTIEIDALSKGMYNFTSPGVLTTPLAPLSDWHSPRTGTRRITIDTSRGRADWEAMLVALRDYDATRSWADNAIENAILLFFDPSWPDSNRAYIWGELNYQARWIWLPMTLIVALLLVKTRPGIRDGLIPFAGLTLIALLLVQTSGVMEGRYRKPAEPLLIAGAVILLHRWRSLRASGVPPTG